MLRRVIFTGVLFYCSLAFGQRGEINAELAKADKLVLEKEYEAALKHVEAALDIDKLYLDALEKKVNIMLLMEKDREILKEIDELVKKNIQQPEYYYIRAVVYNYKQRPSKAIEDLDNALYYQIPGKYQERVYLNRGVAYYYLGNFEAAELDFRGALEINPRYATVYHSWGMMDYEKRMFEEAAKKFNKAVQYGDERPILFYNLGMSYLRIKDMPNACFNFNKACNLGYKSACKLYLLECSE